MEMIDISEQEAINLKILFDYLKSLTEDGITPLIEKQVKWMLDNSLNFFSHLTLQDSFSELFRLTINNRVVNGNNRISEISKLKYPPSDKVEKYGRCNLPKQSVLYAAFSWMTVLNELKPRKGDLITISKWNVKDNQTLLYCPIFRNQPSQNGILNPRTFEFNKMFEKELKVLPKNIKNQITILVQFVADSFSKRIDSGNHLDYIFSAYFADKIFNQFVDGKIEAIYYPSVAEKLSFENIAIKPDVFDLKYELVEVKEDVITMDPYSGNGGYLADAISECNSFDFTTGKILWINNKIVNSKERINILKSKYNINLE